MSFKIEKNVPMNVFSSGKYPFGDMDVGDSFRVEIADRARIAASSSTYARLKNPGMKFSTKKHEDAYRCWRVK